MLPQFPEFIPLSIELKDPYNEKVRPFTPYSDISFATLQIWWNVSEKLSVSVLNNNLVIDYALFHDKSNSGFGLIGENQVDSTIDTLFEYQKAHSMDCRLVHVPEFVVDEIKRKDILNIEEEVDYNEYILDTEALSSLEGPQFKTLRKKVKRFLRTIEDNHLDVRELDLSLVEVQDDLLTSISKWQSLNKQNNDPDDTEREALAQTLAHAEKLNIKSLATFIDNELHGIIIYHRPLDKDYYILHHLKANYSTPFISDYMHHEMAKNAKSNGVRKLNIEMDLGIESLRKHKMTLRPSEILKKFTITPK